MAYPNISHQGGAQRVTGRRHRFFDDHRQHDLDIKVARIFNTYGPRMHPNDGRVVSNFIVQALQGDPITLYGDSGQSRTFCYVDDLVDGLIRLMENPEGYGRTVNLGHTSEITIFELAKMIREMTDSESELAHRCRALAMDEPRKSQPDIRIARERLGWEPKIPLRERLKPTIAYFEGTLI